jgi:DNA-binding transcriptional ArsR family regulator
MSSPDPFSDIFVALADPIRRAILSRLAVEALTAQEIAVVLELSPREVITQISKLDKAGLLVSEPRPGGDTMRLRSDRILLAETWLSWFRRFRIESFDRLRPCVQDAHPPDRPLADTD